MKSEVSKPITRPAPGVGRIQIKDASFTGKWENYNTMVGYYLAANGKWKQAVIAVWKRSK